MGQIFSLAANGSDAAGVADPIPFRSATHVLGLGTDGGHLLGDDVI